MNYEEAKSILIQNWGNLGSSWGINKTMAQIHALLLISPKPLTTEEVMEELNISRGNASINIRGLLDWGVIKKHHVPGDRKEYFFAEKDVWELARTVARERRRKELQPAIKVLDQVNMIQDDQTDEVREFKEMTAKLKELCEHADDLLETLAKLEENKLLKLLLKMS